MASETRLDGPSVGDRLPVGSVRTSDGATIAVRPSPARAVIMLLPHAGCGDCDAYLRQVSQGRARFLRWSAVAITVVAHPSEADRLAAFVDLPVAADGALRHRWGLDEAAAVVVADSHGQVWDSSMAADGHNLPDVDDIEEDVKFIAIQCPECDVLDIPGLGDWEPRADAPR